MRKTAIQHLSALLATERNALLAGDIETVARLADEKEKLAAQFTDHDGQDLSALSSELAHNSALIAAARDGVTAVIKTLTQQKTARMTLSTYDSTGKSATISRLTHGTERRF